MREREREREERERERERERTLSVSHCIYNIDECRNNQNIIDNSPNHI